jgi:phosphoglucomutase
MGLVEAVKRDSGDFGLATDGDRDRFGIADEQGNILTPNTLLRHQNLPRRGQLDTGASIGNRTFDARLHGPTPRKANPHY